MYSTYAIGNDTKSKIYIGHTENLENRLLRHNQVLKNKKTSFTSLNNGEWVLIYKEEFETRSEAMKREKELKSCKGREFIKNMWSKMGR